MDSQVILFTGSRTWEDEKLVSDLLYEIRSIVRRGTPLWARYGDCPDGLDATIARLAPLYGFMMDPMPADWEAYGKAAGPIRNRTMTRKLPKPVWCYAFIRDGSRGATGCAKLAEQAGIPTTRFVVEGASHRVE